jgi:hypothetical protein
VYNLFIYAIILWVGLMSDNAPRKNVQWNIDKPDFKLNGITHLHIQTKTTSFLQHEQQQPITNLSHISSLKIHLEIVALHTTMASFNTFFIFSLAFFLIASPFIQGLISTHSRSRSIFSMIHMFHYLHVTITFLVTQLF